MALKNCKHCGGTIDSSATNCPHCGGKNIGTAESIFYLVGLCCCGIGILLFLMMFI